MQGVQKFQPKMNPGRESGGDSAPVRSSQRDLHARLDEVNDRHFENAWQQPLHLPSVSAFEALSELLNPEETLRLILDSGCGTGESTRQLAAMNPGCLVVGIDRSALRLSKGGAAKGLDRDGNCVLVRAELETFWRLARQSDWRPLQNYLLYPNPWPKAAHLQRRWHAHPVFPDLMALGGGLVLRTNWDIYAREFAHIMSRRTGDDVIVAETVPDPVLSPFEKKYLASGHRLFEVRAQAGNPGS